jgi:hypothetical protein
MHGEFAWMIGALALIALRLATRLSMAFASALSSLLMMK